MGFLSRIVADARAHAPMVRATARDVDRTQAAAEARGDRRGRTSTIAAVAIRCRARRDTTGRAADGSRASKRNPQGIGSRRPQHRSGSSGARPSRPARPAGGPIELAGVACSRRRSDDRVRRPVHSATARESTRARQRGASTLPHRRGRCAPSPRRGPGLPPRRLTGTHARSRRSAAVRASDRRPRRPGTRSADRADRHRSAARRTHRAGGPAGNPRCRTHAHATGGDPARRAASHAGGAERLTRPRATCRDFAARTRHRAAPPGAAEPDDRAGRRARGPHRTDRGDRRRTVATSRTAGAARPGGFSRVGVT